MSFTKARERQQSEPEQASSNREFCCRVPGCTFRWAVDMSHGRVCSMHDDFFSRNPRAENKAKKHAPLPMQAVTKWWDHAAPSRPAEPHWQDDAEAA